MKKYLLLIAMIMVLTACNQEMKASKVVESEMVIEEDYVQYLYDHIDFSFVSDTGHYNWWDLREIEDDALEAQLEMLRLYINSGDFQRAKIYMTEIPDDDILVLEIKINYMIPILMSEDRYEEALKFVLKKSEYTSPHRFRSDLAYLLRYLYLNHGFEDAALIVDALREEYPQTDLSYVWFAISEKNYFDVYHNGLEEPEDVTPADKELLKQLILTYPDEPYIDWAYYLLGDYETLLTVFPDSDIRDRASYKIAYDIYHKIKHEMYDKNYTFDTERLDDVTDAFMDYFNEHLDSEFSIYGVRKVLRLYERYFKMTGDYTYYLNLIDGIIAVEIDENKERLLSSIAWSLRGALSNGKDLIASQDILDDYRASHQDYTQIYNAMSIGLAVNAFYNDHLERAMDCYEQTNYEAFFYRDRNRLEALYQLSSHIGKNEIDDLYEIANTFKGIHENSLAVVYYEKLEEKKLTENEWCQVQMYKAFCYREMKEFDKMFETHESIVEKYPSAALADDALAEMGVYHLLYAHDTQKARELFQSVIQRYPERNAVNNAYNWIAWSYLQDKNYEEALTAYELLVEKFPLNRFGFNARKNIKKIKDVYLNE